MACTQARIGYNDFVDGGHPNRNPAPIVILNEVEGTVEGFDILPSCLAPSSGRGLLFV